jgi:SAM-dependent methyltransferase
MATEAELRQNNTRIWESNYGSGHKLNYPSEHFVRTTHYLFEPKTSPKVLDYGFGSGENLMHLARRGHRMHGVEVSASAVKTAQQRCTEAGLAADLRLVERGGAIPHADGSMDVAIAWEVLSYNDWSTLPVAVKELERVVKPGGIVLATLTAPGHLQEKISEPLGNDLRRINSGNQSGAQIMVVPKPRIAECFPGRQLTQGEFAYGFGGVDIHCWIISYRKDT